MNITGYHATDHDNALKILKDGFTYKPSKVHWIGNGVYFFIDYDLAVWWAGNPTSQFGTTIASPCILKADICVDDDFLDLRKLDIYNTTVKLYYTIKPVLEKVVEPGDKAYDKIIRCAFFDTLRDQYNIKGIIAQFVFNRSQFLTNGVFPPRFYMPYIENQICVFDTSAIKNVAIHS